MCYRLRLQQIDRRVIWKSGQQYRPNGKAFLYTCFLIESMRPESGQRRGPSLVFYSAQLPLENVSEPMFHVRPLVPWLATDFQAQPSTPPRLTLGQQRLAIHQFPTKPINWIIKAINLTVQYYINDIVSYFTEHDTEMNDKVRMAESQNTLTVMVMFSRPQSWHLIDYIASERVVDQLVSFYTIVPRHYICVPYSYGNDKRVAHSKRLTRSSIGITITTLWVELQNKKAPLYNLEKAIVDYR